MRVKPVPAPPSDREGLATIRRAVPLVPEPEGNCCDRLAASTAVDPDEASEWLTFLEGLGLVREGDSGYHRTREDSDPAERGSAGSRISSDDLGGALLDGVYGAREVQGILEEADEQLSAAEVAERFDAVPRWERHRHPDPEAVWFERVERLLGWLVLFGLAERRNGGYSLRS